MGWRVALLRGHERAALPRVDRRAAEGHWHETPGTMARGAAEDIVEACVSFASLGLKPGDPF